MGLAFCGEEDRQGAEGACDERGGGDAVWHRRRPRIHQAPAHSSHTGRQARQAGSIHEVWLLAPERQARALQGLRSRPCGGAPGAASDKGEQGAGADAGASHIRAQEIAGCTRWRRQAGGAAGRIGGRTALAVLSACRRPRERGLMRP